MRHTFKCWVTTCYSTFKMQQPEARHLPLPAFLHLAQATRLSPGPGRELLLLTLRPPFLCDLAQSGRRRDAPVYALLRSLLGLSICAGVNGVPLQFTSIWNLCVCV